ncbi:MAG: hypothetical protein E7Z99_01855 [Coriobacteriaceae bacterium]|nr:hypothetical protein [Coriobacteriaceae bacterium]
MEYDSARGINTELRDRIQAAGKRADALMAQTCAGSPSFEELVVAVKEYTRIRYLLEPEDMKEDVMRYLGELSLARGLGMPVEQVRRTELDTKCKDTSSEMTKKILLVISLNKALGINIDETQTAEITSMSAIAEEAARQYLARRADAVA